MIRGLFAYQYDAEGLRLVPQIPPGITALDQRFPIRFGHKKLYLAATGAGPVTGVLVNDRSWSRFDARSVHFPYADTPDEARVQIILGRAEPRPQAPAGMEEDVHVSEPPSSMPSEVAALQNKARRLSDFYVRLVEAGLGDSYEAGHARLAADYVWTIHDRRRLQADGKIEVLPPETQAAADHSYVNSAIALVTGLEQVLLSYETSDKPQHRKILGIWNDVHSAR
jgi:hypothetical protein